MDQLGIISPALVEREWALLRFRPAALHRATGWQLVPEPLRDLQQIVDLTQPARPDEEREATLRTLVGLARDDDLAARVLLQRLIPDLIRIHRRRSRQRWTHPLGVGLGDLLATGWTVIRTYNPDRRPARLVSSLVSDVEYREYRAPLRRVGQSLPADPLGFDEMIDTTPTDPIVELARLLADPAALDDVDRDLVRRLLSGRMAIDIANELGVTPRTIRNRRDRIVVRLRAAAAAA